MTRRWRRHDDRRAFSFYEKLEMLFAPVADRKIRQREKGVNRPVEEMVETIRDRRKRFEALPPAAQAEVNEHRLVPVEELNQILEYYLENGVMRDERYHRWNKDVINRTRIWADDTLIVTNKGETQ